MARVDGVRWEVLVEVAVEKVEGALALCQATLEFLWFTSEIPAKVSQQTISTD
jgi:hypothetical protein